MLDSNNKPKKATFTRKQYILRLILLIIYIYLLYELYWLILKLGGTPLIAILILTFAFLFFLGLLLKKKGRSLFSLFKRKKKQTSTNYYDKIRGKKPHIRRIDIINLDSKYRNPIIRKCPNCGIELAGFVKQCPNCGEKIVH